MTEDELYRALQSTAGDLVALDPPEGTPLAELLLGLASAIEDYEQARWPLGKPPEPKK